MQQGSHPELSVIMFVGTNRLNAQGVLNALNQQSCADNLLEIVFLDSAADPVHSLNFSTRARNGFDR